MNNADGKKEALHFLGVIDGIKNVPIKEESLVLITAIFAGENKEGSLNIDGKKLSEILDMPLNFINDYIENLLYWGFIFKEDKNNTFLLNSYFTEKENMNSDKGAVKKTKYMNVINTYKEENERFSEILKEAKDKYKDSERFTASEVLQGEIQYLLGEAMDENSKASDESLTLMKIVNNIAGFCEGKLNKYGKGFESSFVKIENDYRAVLESYVFCREHSQKELTKYEKSNNKESMIDCINKDTEDIEKFNLYLAERAAFLRDLITKRSIVDINDRDKMQEMIKEYNKCVYNRKKLKLSLI